MENKNKVYGTGEEAILRYLIPACEIVKKEMLSTIERPDYSFAEKDQQVIKPRLSGEEKPNLNIGKLTPEDEAAMVKDLSFNSGSSFVLIFASVLALITICVAFALLIIKAIA